MAPCGFRHPGRGKPRTSPKRAAAGCGKPSGPSWLPAAQAWSALPSRSDLPPVAASCPLQQQGLGRATGSLRYEGFFFVRVHVIFVSATAGRHQPRAPAPLVRWHGRGSGEGVSETCCANNTGPGDLRNCAVEGRGPHPCPAEPFQNPRDKQEDPNTMQK